jgi:hypothetical protein
MDIEKAIGIGQKVGVDRQESSCDYSFLCKVKQALEENSGDFIELAYIQKLIDVLEAA